MSRHRGVKNVIDDYDEYEDFDPMDDDESSTDYYIAQVISKVGMMSKEKILKALNSTDWNVNSAVSLLKSQNSKTNQGRGQGPNKNQPNSKKQPQPKGVPQAKNAAQTKNFQNTNFEPQTKTAGPASLNKNLNQKTSDTPHQIHNELSKNKPEVPLIISRDQSEELKQSNRLGQNYPDVNNEM